MRSLEGSGAAWRRCATGGLLLVLGLVRTAALALDFEPRPVVASLWTEHDSIAPGEPFTLGLRLLHAPGWHSYWTVPGDSGLPTRIRWNLPAGISAGRLQWPAPRRLPIGPLVDYGYEGDTLLLTDLKAAPDLVIGSQVRIQAHAQWLMCRDVCIPAADDLVLTLPVRQRDALLASANSAAFEQARERIPRELKLQAARATRAGSNVTLAFSAPAAGRPHRLEFFPLEPGRIEPSAPQTLRSDGNTVQLELTAAQPVGADFRTLRGVLVSDGGPDAGGWMGTIEVPLTDASN
jgi:DsbC/DsbD-like thiol-disulfide interchange protein